MAVATATDAQKPFGEIVLHRLLVAIDGSGNAELAVTAAITAARRDNATLTLITVSPELTSGTAAWSVPLGSFTQLDIDTDAQRQLSETVARIPDDIPVTTIYRRGKPGPEIVKAAAEGDYDAIILGARGVGRIGAMLGSVSGYVLHHAGTAVFVAHAAREKRG